MADTTRNETWPSQQLHTVNNASIPSNRLTSILSSSFVDADTRTALRLFDARYSNHGHDPSFDLKYEAQKEAIQANGEIVDDFARVAQVCLTVHHKVGLCLTQIVAAEAGG